MQVTLRPLTKQDALAFWELAFADSNAEWRQWDGPSIIPAVKNG